MDRERNRLASSGERGRLRRHADFLFKLFQPDPKDRHALAGQGSFEGRRIKFE